MKRCFREKSSLMVEFQLPLEQSKLQREKMMAQMEFDYLHLNILHDNIWRLP